MPKKVVKPVKIEEEAIEEKKEEKIESEEAGVEEIMSNININSDTAMIIEIFDDKEIQDKLKPDEYNLFPIPVLKRSTYTQALKRSVDKYRKSHPEVIQQISKRSYEKIKADPEKKAKFNKQCCESQKRLREQAKKEKEKKGEDVLKVGRPKQILSPTEMKEKKRQWNRKYREKIEEKLKIEKEAKIANGEVIVETRGRKPKPIVVVENAEVVEKRPRGRPRKVVADLNEASGGISGEGEIKE